jgi:L-amino acid N-acyltransferase YncA
MQRTRTIGEATGVVAGPGQVTAAIRDGVAALRPLRAGEIEPQLAVFEGLSPASRTSRFLHPVTSLSRGMREVLSAVDGVERVAWLASVDGLPAGIGRYAAVAHDTAEVAFEVVDAHQGKGLGAVLLDVVTTLAASAGFHRLEGLALASNDASAHLLRSIGLPLVHRDGLLEGEGRFRLLPRPRVDRAAVLALAHDGALARRSA